jgi:hypothetical protein
VLDDFWVYLCSVARRDRYVWDVRLIPVVGAVRIDQGSPAARQNVCSMPLRQVVSFANDACCSLGRAAASTLVLWKGKPG